MTPFNWTRARRQDAEARAANTPDVDADDRERDTRFLRDGYRRVRVTVVKAYISGARVRIIDDRHPMHGQVIFEPWSSFAPKEEEE